MKNTKVLLAIIMLFLTSCYGINEKSTEIGSLNTNCLDSLAWVKIAQSHSVEKITESLFLEQLSKFKIEPFETELFYFDVAPKEIIAVSTDHYQVRYVYNPEIAGQILDGLSPQLGEKEDRDRIRNRIQLLLMPYQCKEGRMKSVELLKK